MTPHELNMQIEEWSSRLQAEHRERITIAYLTAYWHRIRKMPTLKKVLEDIQLKKKRPQTPEEMLAMVRVLNAALGGKEVSSRGETNTDGNAESGK
ncbi:hypothetical protein ACFSL6_17675 [Paenibacillus thailandensis]|uniref:Uncharacterized protein n=1 Tax=Paenibacillus thailandensis TaxID=393250 RepID=A0ABW5QT94_9BACL